MLLFSPLVLYSLALDIEEIKCFLIVVAAMLPLISSFCFLGSIFTFKLANHKNFLIYIIVLPLIIPEIIFIMLTLKNIFIYADFLHVRNYLEYMIYLNLILLPLNYLIAKNSLKSVLISD